MQNTVEPFPTWLNSSLFRSSNIFRNCYSTDQLFHPPQITTWIARIKIIPCGGVNWRTIAEWLRTKSGQIRFYIIHTRHNKFLSWQTVDVSSSPDIGRPVSGGCQQQHSYCCQPSSAGHSQSGERGDWKRDLKHAQSPSLLQLFSRSVYRLLDNQCEGIFLINFKDNYVTPPLGNCTTT